MGIIFVVLDGATNLLWAKAQPDERNETTLQSLRDWMDQYQCRPRGILADIAFSHPTYTDSMAYVSTRQDQEHHGPVVPRLPSGCSKGNTNSLHSSHKKTQQFQIPHLSKLFKNVCGQETIN
jgi:hypothetical protein